MWFKPQETDCVVLLPFVYYLTFTDFLLLNNSEQAICYTRKCGCSPFHAYPMHGMDSGGDSLTCAGHDPTFSWEPLHCTSLFQWLACLQTSGLWLLDGSWIWGLQDWGMSPSQSLCGTARLSSVPSAHTQTHVLQTQPTTNSSHTLMNNTNYLNPFLLTS